MLDMLPLNIYLIRHGQTEGNVDHKLYREKADHAIRLTPKGIEQATEAGVYLSERLKSEQQEDPGSFGKIRLWHSPYYRARETALHILRPLGRLFNATEEDGFLTYREEPFLMEQKAGLFDGLNDDQFGDLHPHESRDYDKHLQFNGRAYAKVPQGESRMDVVIRVKHVCGTIVDDYRTHGIRHVIVVNHGVTLRAFAMAWMRYTPEWLDAEKNPGNCWIRHISGTRATGYKDGGYIHGYKAPLGDSLATQRHLVNPQDIFMLAPNRPGTIVPPGVNVIDPFARDAE